jgi:hypothetical protein
MGEGAWGGSRGSVEERQEAEIEGAGKIYFFHIKHQNVILHVVLNTELSLIPHPQYFPPNFYLFIATF